jgi:hypothetical protein
VGRVLALDVVPEGEATARPVQGWEKLSLLRRDTGHGGLAPLIRGEAACFRDVTTLARAVDVERLTRPHGPQTRQQMLGLAEAGSFTQDRSPPESSAATLGYK